MAVYRKSLWSLAGRGKPKSQETMNKEGRYQGRPDICEEQHLVETRRRFKRSLGSQNHRQKGCVKSSITENSEPRTWGSAWATLSLHLG